MKIGTKMSHIFSFFKTLTGLITLNILALFFLYVFSKFKILYSSLVEVHNYPHCHHVIKFMQSWLDNLIPNISPLALLLILNFNLILILNVNLRLIIYNNA